jgi:hypothetical protein
LLGSFTGILQSDQYGAYASHERKTDGIVRVGCWAHARRKFHEAIDERPKAANLVLRVISKLYQWEAAWDAAKVGDARATLRREHFARPLHWLKVIVAGLSKQALPQSQLGKACAYPLNHWDVLVAHQQHSVTRLDNNDAGQRSAIIYSLVISCQRHGKDPHAYLCDVLRRLPSMTNQDDLTPLTPAAWQPT